MNLRPKERTEKNPPSQVVYLSLLRYTAPQKALMSVVDSYLPILIRSLVAAEVTHG